MDSQVDWLQLDDTADSIGGRRALKPADDAAETAQPDADSHSLLIVATDDAFAFVSGGVGAADDGEFLPMGHVQASPGITHLPPEAETPTLADEVAFIAGVDSNGVQPLDAFYAWNNDTPATYTGGYTNSRKWGAQTADTPGGTISYFFNTSSNWSQTEKNFFVAGLSLWSAVANISFTQASSLGSAQIVFTRGSNGNAATSDQTTDNNMAHAGETGSPVLLQLTKATISIDTSVAGFGPIRDMGTYGGYPIMTLLHEEGHALGLGHGGPYNGDVNEGTQQFSPYDARLWSIMSYIEPRASNALYYNQYPVQGADWGLSADNHHNDPTGLMPLDILAIQALYGTPTSTPLAGGQVFGFNSNIFGPLQTFFNFNVNTHPVLTLWDAGTNNTLDLSGWYAPSTVNLSPGTFSSVNGMTDNLAIAFGTAIDSFIGGAGADSVTANGDGDTFQGNNGNDGFTGGAGIDTAVYTGNYADYTIADLGGGSFRVTDNRPGSPDGSDILQNVEQARFANGTITLGQGASSTPQLTGAGNDDFFTEQQSAVNVSTSLIVADLGSTTINGATVTISAGYVAGDQLLFNTYQGITGAYDQNTHALTLSGTANVTDYQTALRSVQFYTGSDDPTALGTSIARTVTFVASNAGQNSNAVTSTVHVFGVNDPPVVGNAGNSIFYTEQSAPIAIDSNITVTDPDSATLTAAAVVIASGYESGDTLGFVNQNGITGTYDAAQHRLQLLGTASVAAYQAALRSVTFSSSSDNPDNYGQDGPITITWGVLDGQADSVSTTSVIHIVAVDDAPVLGGAGNTINYAAGDGPIAVDAALTAADPDNLTLSGATITIANGYVAGDFLLFSDANGISSSYNAATHTMTLSGSASVATYQAALRSVTYASLAGDPTAGGANTARTITWQVSDGSVPSAAVSSTIAVTTGAAPALGGTGNTVNYVAHANPVAPDSAITVSDADSANLAGATITISSGYVAGDLLLFNDANGISSSYNAATHTMTLGGTASVAAYQAALRAVTYASLADNPAAGGNTSRTITWQVNDGSHQSTAATSTIAITTNTAPVLGGAGNTVSYTAHANPVAPDGAITASDADSANLTGATITISNGYLSGDLLLFQDANGISSSYNAATHTMTLSGSASVAAYQAALRAVTYASLADDPAAGGHTSRTISWQVSDGSLPSGTVNSTIVIDAAPVLGGAGNTVSYAAHDNPVTLDGVIAASDADSANLTGATITISSGYVSGDLLLFHDANGISSSYNAAAHTMTLSGVSSVANYQAALRSMTYASLADDPTVGGSISRTITWQVSDGTLASAAVTSTVTVSGGSHALPLDDHFVFDSGAGNAAVDYAAGDVVELHGAGLPSFDALLPLMSQVGPDVVIALDSLDHLTLHNAQMTQLTAGDFILS